MRGHHLESLNRYSRENRVEIDTAKRSIALLKCGKPDAKKTSSPIDVVQIQRRSDFSLAMVNYNTRHSSEAYDPNEMRKQAKLVKEGKKDEKPLPRAWDLTAYIVYDHRSFKPLEEIAERVFNTVLDDSVFMQIR